MINADNFYPMSPAEGATTLSIMTFSLATLSMKGLNVTLRINGT